ncbi:hybrid sensor histidine kinase/response regulator [Mongoliitalea daihaiensis]|uniref:hybrid sensor histidine kinase/response regulator n=1 Tax=Mongoliitalea daihaiensis TaxID=2782006 RepID=UPI001F35A34E|nr:hybrid sensor histidine kinase/response regulator [Mongoliitalea daihaiensis]UJP65043.1 hybrid sensor histidine kinase/response regulator [Mongoliitalea daihaiensis]
MTETIRVLYIDDEANNLTSFRASLRKFFDITTALDAAEGLELVTSQEFQVVVADQRMPGLTGVEFFEQLTKINPDPIRILLTGYSDIVSVIDAINKGEVYRFIDKPWNLDQIKNAIVNAAEIYRTRQELKEKTERLEKIQIEMNQFVYSLSHELRGPLMSISGVSKLAQMEVDEPIILEYFEMIDSATTKLDDFIYKMLDFYRSTKMENQITNIDFKTIVEQQVSAYREKWDLTGFNILSVIEQQREFFSDDAKVRVILNNLFSNAYNFHKELKDNPWIKIEIQVIDECAIISVEDNGSGIERDLQPGIFNLFQRASKKNAGSGLGLYMVKESVTQMGGEIKLVSEAQVGTKVIVRLPSMEQTKD